MKFNYDVNKRDNMIFGEDYCKEKYLGGARHFDRIDYQLAKELINCGFMDPEEAQNCSPYVEDLVDFLEEHNNFYAFGYVISPERQDYRVSLEGIASDEPFKDLEDAKEFIDLCRSADEFSVNLPYAWWD